MPKRKYANMLAMGPKVIYKSLKPNMPSVAGALHDHKMFLPTTFKWSDSPQGHGFWQTQQSEATLSREAKRFLLAMVIEWGIKNYKYNEEYNDHNLNPGNFK